MRLIRIRQLGVVPIIPIALAPVGAAVGGAAGAGIWQQILNFLRNWRPANQTNQPQPCPTDTKTCPDGSVVTRTGADCQFPPCPVVETPWYQKPEILIGGAVVLLLLVFMTKGGRRNPPRTTQKKNPSAKNWKRKYETEKEKGLPRYAIRA